MTRRILFTTRILFLLFCPLYVLGQKNGPYAGEIKKAAEIIESAQNVAYKYSMKAEYPNSEKDHVNGEVYINAQQKLMYNDNDAFSMVYSSKWYYKADHRNKTITIVNLEKHLAKEYRESIQHDVFDNGLLSYYFDSVILRYGSVKNLKRVDNNTQMDLTFPDGSPIRYISISYDGKEKRLTACSIQTFQPWATNEFGKNKGTTQTVVCEHFRKIEDDKVYRAESFFTVKKNKAVLKKYKKYKLIVKL